MTKTLIEWMLQDGVDTGSVKEARWYTQYPPCLPGDKTPKVSRLYFELMERARIVAIVYSPIDEADKEEMEKRALDIYYKRK